MPDVVMPRLSDSMEEGTVLRWLREEGDTVRRGEALVEIETDKATMTYEADGDGVLEILARVGDTLPIGEVIARIGEKSSVGAVRETSAAAGLHVDGGEDPGASPPVGDGKAPVGDGEDPGAGPPVGDGKAPVDGGEDPGASPPVGDGKTPVNDVRVRASPLARRIARDHGVELAGLTGSGPGGRVIRADVEAAVQGDTHAQVAEPGPGAPTPRPLPQPAGDSPGAAATNTRPDGDSSAAPAANTRPASGDSSGAPAADTQLPDGLATPAPAAAEAQPVAPAMVTDGPSGRGEATIQALTRAQQVVARRMAESRATIPDFTLRSEVDMEGCVTLRARLAELRPAMEAVPTYNDMIVRACALALREHPRANASYRDGRFELHGRVNVGIAVAAQDALVVPTVFDADRKSLSAIARETRGLAGRVRDGVITPPELSGGTFTVSNLGMYGVSSFTAVINPPQAAILSVGSVAPRAVVRDGVLVARATADLTLACDHRILYGADAARFLQRVRELLTEPLALAL